MFPQPTIIYFQDCHWFGRESLLYNLHLRFLLPLGQASHLEAKPSIIPIIPTWGMYMENLLWDKWCQSKMPQNLLGHQQVLLPLHLCFPTKHLWPSPIWQSLCPVVAAVGLTRVTTPWRCCRKRSCRLQILLAPTGFLQRCKGAILLQMDQVVFGFLGKVAESMVAAWVNLNSMMNMHSGLCKWVKSGVQFQAQETLVICELYVNLILVSNKHNCGLKTESCT